MGDFNTCDPDQRRLNARNPTFSDGNARHAAALIAAFPRSVEIAQPNFTRKGERRDGSIRTLSGIDRISSISQCQTCMTSSAMNTLLGPLAKDLCPAIISPCD